MKSAISKFLCFFALLSASLMAVPTLVVVSQTLYRADGTTAKGTVYVQWQTFTAASGEQVPGGTKEVRLTSAGLLSVALVPNVGASPAGTHYNVTYRLDFGQPHNVSWIVPASGPVTVSAIESTILAGPSSVVALSQLSQSGATSGQCAIWNGAGSWVPGACGAGSSPAFSAILTGINIGATMTMGSGSSLVRTGTGIIDANKILGTTLTSLTGLAKLTAGVPSIAVAADVYALWSGSCSSSTFMRGDGTCAAPSPLFSAIGTATNINTLTIGSGGTFTYSGSGIVNANKILGATLTSLTGPAKLTAGIPSVAVAADIYGLWSGGCDNTKWLRGDGACATPSGAGDVSSNTATSVDGEMALFSGVSGKTIKRAAGTGIPKLTSGVVAMVTAPTGTLVGTTDSQTLTNKTLTTPTIASLVNATHNHSNGAGGGLLDQTAVGTANREGDGTKFQMFTGADAATEDCAKFDATHNLVTAGANCGDGTNVASFSATPAFNLALGQLQKITLTNNVTSSTVTNPVSGRVYIFQICQDGTGSWTFVWPTSFKAVMAIGSLLSTCSVQSVVYDGTSFYALGGVNNQ